MSQVALVRSGLVHAVNRLNEIAGQASSLRSRVLALHQKVVFTLAESESSEAVSARTLAMSAEVELRSVAQSARAAGEQLLALMYRI